jgi:hypothetical protein
MRQSECDRIERAHCGSSVGCVNSVCALGGGAGTK